MYRLGFTVALAAIIAAGATCVQATVRVGEANSVERNVFGSQVGQGQRKVLEGDDVYENDLIRTEMASSARILFVDETDVNIGPAAALKLDRVVFNPDQSIRALTVIAKEGAIRWTSGHSLSRAYEVKTPTALVRVHGTIFDLFVEPQRTTVLLREGIIEVCLANEPDHCRTVSASGDLISVTSSAIEGPRQGGPGASEFAALCLSPASSKCVLAANVDPSPKPFRRADIGNPEHGSATSRSSAAAGRVANPLPEPPSKPETPPPYNPGGINVLVPLPPPPRPETPPPYNPVGINVLDLIHLPPPPKLRTPPPGYPGPLSVPVPSPTPPPKPARPPPSPNSGGGIYLVDGSTNSPTVNGTPGTTTAPGGQGQQGNSMSAPQSTGGQGSQPASIKRRGTILAGTQAGSGQTHQAVVPRGMANQETPVIRQRRTNLSMLRPPSSADTSHSSHFDTAVHTSGRGSNQTTKSQSSRLGGIHRRGNESSSGSGHATRSPNLRPGHIQRVHNASSGNGHREFSQERTSSTLHAVRNHANVSAGRAVPRGSYQRSGAYASHASPFRPNYVRPAQSSWTSRSPPSFAQHQYHLRRTPY